jgi:hypothetical protein
MSTEFHQQKSPAQARPAWGSMVTQFEWKLHGGPVSRNQADDEQHQKRAENRPEPARRRRIGDWRTIERVANGATYERSDDSQYDRQDDSQRLPTRHEQASDCTRDQTENYPAKNMHGYSS